MDETYLDYKISRTTILFDKINILWYLASLPDFWIADVKLPKTFQAIYNRYMKVQHYVMIAFALMTVGAYLTQHDLTPEQQHSMVIGFASCTSVTYRIVECHYKADIKKIIYYLTVYLKEFNKEEVEIQFLRKIKCFVYLFIYASIGSMILRGVSGAFQVYKGGFFITFITMWPDVKDDSLAAEIARYIIYLMWYIILLQIVGAILMVMIIMLLLSQQYKNLASYFYTLNDIFHNKHKSQVAKEREYEARLLKGLHWHSITLWCVERCQYVFKIIYNVHMTIAPLILTFILPELLDPEVDIRTKVEQVPVLISILVCLGFFMWPAGDVTVEASKLAEALYSSGWHNCYGHNGVRLKKMIIFAMQQAQKPVVLKAFNTFTLSYESYVTIIKTSYSLFSVLAL